MGRKHNCATASCKNVANAQDKGDKRWYCDPCFAAWENRGTTNPRNQQTKSQNKTSSDLPHHQRQPQKEETPSANKKKKDFSGLEDWAGQWVFRCLKERRSSRRDVGDEGQLIGLPHTAALQLIHWQRHFPFIVSLGVSLWRRLIVMLGVDQTFPSRPFIAKSKIKNGGDFTKPYSLGTLGNLNNMIRRPSILPEIFLRERRPVTPQSILQWCRLAGGGPASGIDSPGVSEVSSMGQFLYGALYANQVDVLAVMKQELQFDLEAKHTGIIAGCTLRWLYSSSPPVADVASYPNISASTIRFLIKSPEAGGAGADYLAVDTSARGSGRQAIHWAAMQGRLDVVQLLVEHHYSRGGSSSSSKASNGGKRAGDNNNPDEVLDFVDVPDEYGQTPLQHVASCSQKDVRRYTALAKYLIEQGADVNAKGPGGELASPLARAENAEAEMLREVDYSPTVSMLSKLLESHGAKD